MSNFANTTRAFMREWIAKMTDVDLLSKFEAISKLKDDQEKKAVNPYGKDMFLFERFEDLYNIMEAELIARTVQENKPTEGDYNE